MFSIVMPAYNARKFIHESINSVLNQTYGGFELIVINDGSTDDTGVVVSGFSSVDSRVKLIDNKVNKGVAASRNDGIAFASGRYICFLDADDLWFPEKLEVQKRYFSQGYDYLFSSYFKFWPSGRKKQIIPPERTSFKALLKGNYIGNLTGAYDTSSIGKVFQKEIGHEDYFMWLEIAKVAKSGIGIQTPLASYRVHEGSLSANKIRSAMWSWNIYRNELNFGLLRSLLLFSNYAINSLRKI